MCTLSVRRAADGRAIYRSRHLAFQMMGFSVALMGTIAHQCQPMTTYQAPYVATTYNLTKHMGKYYELAFRDLYPWGPLCDCQQVRDTRAPAARSVARGRSSSLSPPGRSGGSRPPPSRGGGARAKI